MIGPKVSIIHKFTVCTYDFLLCVWVTLWFMCVGVKIDTTEAEAAASANTAAG